MRILLLAASALALSVGTQSFAQGHGRGGGGGHGNQGEGHAAHGQGHGGGRGNAPQMVEQRGNGGPGHGRGHERRAERAEQRGGPPAHARGNGRREVRQAVEDRRGRDDARGRGHGRDDAVVEAPRGNGNGRVRRMQRQAARVTDPAQIARLRVEPSRGLIDGCPPGLARKNNGCMPPGQLRQQTGQSALGNLWPALNPQSYRYDDGYLVQLAPNGGVAGYLPLLGGALAPGQQWPAQYNGYQVPDYYSDYYGLPDGYDYRYADGALYSVDPQTNMIQQVAALLTGDQWNVGQRMPDGYGVYNVPSEYRDTYYDTPEAMYRYSDGYVYQVDPTTQLIQAAIQLVT